MKSIRYIIFLTLISALFITTACHKLLDEPAENRTFTGETDYTISSNMILPLLGTYAEFNNTEWEGR
jgi:starch-binding outer membrane protein, SusD/RagB family